MKCILTVGNEISSIKSPVCRDLKLNAIYASSSQPHIILIDPNGKITSIHLSNYLTSSNIRTLSLSVDLDLSTRIAISFSNFTDK